MQRLYEDFLKKLPFGTYADSFRRKTLRMHILRQKIQTKTIFYIPYENPHTPTQVHILRKGASNPIPIEETYSNS